MKKNGAAILLVASLGAGTRLRAEPIAVRHPEGVVRGFLVLRASDGTVLADGDSIQSSNGDRVTTRLVFHFRDGSLHDETAVFSQRGRFQLLSDHLVQRGASFPYPIELRIDAQSGRVTVRKGEAGNEKIIEKTMKLPEDLSNGITPTLIKNLDASAGKTTLSMLIAAPKPRLVKLVVTPAGVEPMSAGRSSYAAFRFRVKVELGGLAGWIAPLIGKQPREASVWIVRGEAPGFVRSESQFYPGGPLWTIELASPEYPRTSG